MVLDVKDILKRYSDVLVVDNVSLSVRECVVFGLIGPNGAGKNIPLIPYLPYQDRFGKHQGFLFIKVKER